MSSNGGLYLAHILWVDKAIEEGMEILGYKDVRETIYHKKKMSVIAQLPAQLPIQLISLANVWDFGQ